MNENVKMSVEARKNSLLQMCGDNSEFSDKIDTFMKELEDYAEGFETQESFESAMLQSPLATEYADLFAEISKKTNPVSLFTAEDVMQQVAEEAVDWTRYAADSATQPLRRAARAEAKNVLRENVPGFGEVETASNLLGFFKRFKKK